MDVLVELVWRLRLNESFIIQVDENTDVVNFAVLLAFVWYIYEGEFQEGLLICKSTEAQTGEDIYEIVYQFLIKHQTDRDKGTDVCIDGAESITGKTVGTLCSTKIKQPDILYVPLRQWCDVQLPS
jgi:hypothetical protein